MFIIQMYQNRWKLNIEKVKSFTLTSRSPLEVNNCLHIGHKYKSYVEYILNIF